MDTYNLAPTQPQSHVPLSSHSLSRQQEWRDQSTQVHFELQIRKQSKQTFKPVTQCLNAPRTCKRILDNYVDGLFDKEERDCRLAALEAEAAIISTLLPA